MHGNVYYLNNDDIVCMDRTDGESRFPYNEDGTTFWAYSTGFTEANRHGLKIFHAVRANEEPRIDFFASFKNEDGTYTPVSITGAARQMFEPEGIERYTVFTRECPFYILRTPDAVFAVRVFVSTKEKFNFTLTAINTSENKCDVCISSYIEPLLTFSNDPGFWDRMAIKSKYLGDRKYVINHHVFVSRNMGMLNEKITDAQPYEEHHTIARKSFTGGYGRGLHCAAALKYGRLENPHNATAREDFPAFCDIYKFDLKKSDSTRIDYQFEYAINKIDDESYKISEVDIDSLEKAVLARKKKYEDNLAGCSLKFGKLKYSKVDNELLNKFFRTVQHSVTFISENHDYGGRMQGIRDVYQQLEIYLLWNPERARANIVRYFNYFYDSGRISRSIGLESTDWMAPSFVRDEYIDQGLWVIACVYTYLCYTNDYSILDEMCTSYHINEAETQWTCCEEKTSVLEHMLRIMDYFIRNLDTEYGTNCLRILKGDWNDSINGLGATDDKNKRFGSGVTVMGSLQLYENFAQMIEILSHVGGYDAVCKKYAECREKLADGLMKYAVDGSDDDRQIIHGWGDKISYKVASLCDEDGKRRYGLVSNSFWALSGLIRKSPELKKAIMNAYGKLDSKFGLKTFEPPFSLDMTGVGRMRFILPGMAENACAYVHASIFAIMSLFTIGESEMGWKQFDKTLPISHDFINTSPFVMSNQYCCNDEYELNGEAMYEWVSGSNPTIIKTVVKYGLGIAPDLDFLKIAPAKVMPSDEVKVTFIYKGHNVTVNYKNKNSASRKFYVNSKAVESSYDELSDTMYIKIANKDINGDITIDIED